MGTGCFGSWFKTRRIRFVGEPVRSERLMGRLLRVEERVSVMRRWSRAAGLFVGVICPLLVLILPRDFDGVLVVFWWRFGGVLVPLAGNPMVCRVSTSLSCSFRCPRASDAHARPCAQVQDIERSSGSRSPQGHLLRAGELAGGAGAGGVGNGSVSAELTSLAAGYLVSLLKEPEVAQELWPLIARCMDNVVARRSVPASLEVLRRAIATLPAHEAKNWFGASKSKENRFVLVVLVVLYQCRDEMVFRWSRNQFLMQQVARDEMIGSLPLLGAEV